MLHLVHFGAGSWLSPDSAPADYEAVRALAERRLAEIRRRLTSLVEAADDDGIPLLLAATRLEICALLNRLHEFTSAETPSASELTAIDDHTKRLTAAIVHALPLPPRRSPLGRL